MPRAGLSPAAVTQAAAAVADEVGFPQLSMCQLAERLGVRTPSLYKHVASQADLTHRIATLAVTELGDAIGHAIEGRAGRDAVAAGTQAMRAYVKAHPGRYAAINNARPTGPDDPFIAATQQAISSLAAMVHGYQLDSAEEVHVLRMLRSVLHGFATLETATSFQLSTDIDDSFTWLINFIDHGLRAITSSPDTSRPAQPVNDDWQPTP